MIVPPAEVACAVGEGNQSAVHLHRIELVPLSVQVFEMIHFGTYRADTLLLYARLSSVAQLDSDDARYSIRQAWSSSDLEAAKQRLDTVEALENRLNAAWKHLRWLLDVMNFARERFFQSQMSNSNCSKSASNSQLEMKSAKSNSVSLCEFYYLPCTVSNAFIICFYHFTMFCTIHSYCNCLTRNWSSPGVAGQDPD